MNIKTVVTGEFAVNCYVLWSDRKKAIVIDPGFNAEQISDVIQENGLEVAAHICTHGHADHVNALAALHKLHPAPVHIHSEDWKWVFSDTNQIPPYYGIPESVPAYTALESSKEWLIEDLRFQCIETPGHTPGCVCLYFQETNDLFTGDTLFKGACGRTDLPGGNARQLAASLKELRNLPDAVRVYPGHGPDSTIGIEKQTNFFMMPN